MKIIKVMKIYPEDDIREIFVVKKNEDGEDVFYKDGEPFTGYIEIYGYEERIQVRGQLKDGKRYKKNTQYYPNGQEKIEEYYSENGKRNGTYKIYYETGILQIDGFLENDEKAGHWKWYYPTGVIKEEGNFINGEMKGAWKLYYPDGNVEREIESFLDGKTEILKGYDENRNLIFEGFMYNGKKHGKYLRYYDSGELEEEGEYKEGLLENEVKTYDKNGNLRYITTYSEDEVIKKYDAYTDITRYYGNNLENLSEKETKEQENKILDSQNTKTSVPSKETKPELTQEQINKLEADKKFTEIQNWLSTGEEGFFGSGVLRQGNIFPLKKFIERIENFDADLKKRVYEYVKSYLESYLETVTFDTKGKYEIEEALKIFSNIMGLSIQDEHVKENEKTKIEKEKKLTPQQLRKKYFLKRMKGEDK